MQARIISWFNGLLARWQALQRGQKIRIIGISVIVVAAIAVLVAILLNPKTVTLQDRLNASTASDLEAALIEEGLWAKMSDNGREVLVRQDDLARARAVVAERDFAALKGYTFSDVLDATGMGTSSKVITESLRRATETDIANMLMAMRNVEHAMVQLVIPDSSMYFLSLDEEASAFITLTTTGKIDRATGEAMARGVSMSVKGLSLDNIVIIDQDGYIVYASNTTEGGSFSDYSDFEAAYQAAKEAQAKNFLKSLYKDVRIISNFRFNWDKIYEESLSYVNTAGNENTGLINQSHTINQSSSGTDQGNEPGAEANNAVAPAYNQGTAGSSESSYKEVNTDYLYDVIKRVTEGVNTGKFLTDDSAMSFIVTEERVYNEDYYTAYDLMDGLTWEQFKAAIPEMQSVDVREGLVELVQNGMGLNNIQILAYERAVFVDSEVRPIDIWQIVMMVILAIFLLLIAYGVLKRTQSDEVTEVEPELSVEDLLVSTQIEEEREAERLEEERLREIEYSEDSETKRQIDKFVNERPDAVAQLLRTWINDDWE